MTQEFFIQQIKNHGLTIEEVERQLKVFKKGTPSVHLSKAATIDDGIKVIDHHRQAALSNIFDQNSSTVKIVKFVPASGAASRMFRDLETLVLEHQEIDDTVLNLDSNPAKSGKKFIQDLLEFPFYKKLKKCLEENGYEIATLLKEKKYTPIFKLLLNPEGLNYSASPKAIIEFHSYKDEVRTAFEEHFVEGIEYGSSENVVYLHFTVSPDFEDELRALADDLISKYKKENISFKVSFSFQQPSTDTIAVTLNNDPFIKDDGNILFRPGGHGALLQNLNNVSGDVVFIKNIDNVLPDRLKPDTIHWKKVLGGKLLEIREQVFNFLNQIDANTFNPVEISEYIKNELNLSHPQLDENPTAELLKFLLNRPIRVCGMVENKGEPGGGPYWVKKEELVNSLQIVETSQMDLNNEAQRKLVEQATHFNPVDIVCMLNNYKGETFELDDFIDPNTAFIANKSYEGRALKALERPGLWNGGMAHWITIFVEVPVSTFNPVKTVFDLLRDGHKEIRK